MKIRANGADTVYMSFGAMIKDFIREDLIVLYRLVMQKYGTNRPENAYDRVLWSDLRTMFDPPLIEDAIWSLPLQQKMPTIEENGVTRPKKYSELYATEAIQADCDVKATDIILQGLPPEVYALVSNHKVTKELWERILLLMQGTSLAKQERECKLYDEFDKFAYKKGETLLNTKFLNTLPSEWSKFVTDVKLVRDLQTTNIDQLHAYLGQHEFHANDVRLMHERNSYPLTFVATHQMTQSPYPTHHIRYLLRK
ncbi:hypothetical protein Tco_0929167 [Tanacetum coccineum]